MVRWFGCFGKSHDKDPSKAKKSSKSKNVNGASDAETAALNNHDAADGVREVLREKVSVVEHPANNVSHPKESSALSTAQPPHTTATVSRSPSKTLKELRDEFFHIERVTPYPESRNATPTTKTFESNNMAYLGHGEVPPVVQEYDDIFQSSSLQTYFNLSRQIGGEVQTQASIVERLFALERDFLVLAANHKKPADAVLKGLLEPISQRIQAVQDIREKNRASKLFTHLSAVSESIPALGWIAVSPTPAPYIKEMIDAGQFYTNRVLKDYKDKEPLHVDWAKAWIETLQQLQVFVKKNHTTGVSWNPRGNDVSGVPHSTSAARNLGAGPAPPPPGPPPPIDPQFFKCNFPPQDRQPDVRAALFQEINKGDKITTGLKKVSPDMQTHKNTALRAGAVVPDKAPLTPPGRGGVKVGPSGPVKLELNGKKWEVHNHQGNANIVIDQTEMNHSIYIYRCADSVVTVKGKVSSITVDSCSKTAVVCESLVSFAEIVNSQRTQIQVTGKVPTIQIDKSDGVQIYLSKDSMDCEVFSAKSSEMNVSVPKADGDFMELPVPEQFRTRFDSSRGKLVTEANEQA